MSVKLIVQIKNYIELNWTSWKYFTSTFSEISENSMQYLKLQNTLSLKSFLVVFAGGGGGSGGVCLH